MSFGDATNFIQTKKISLFENVIMLTYHFSIKQKSVYFKIDKNDLNEQDVPFHMQKEILPLQYDGVDAMKPGIKFHYQKVCYDMH